MSEEIKTCPFCGEETNINSEKCNVCGESLLKTCPFCGEKVNIKAIKCKHCGEYLNKENSTGKSWVKTYLLCCFLGIFGVHNFYNGKNGIGVGQLLTLGGLGIWWFIDLIKILNNTYTDANGNKLSKKVTKSSTALLCFFTCSHRFYTEKFGSAWGLLALNWLSSILLSAGIPLIIVPLIWWFVDFIMILCGSFKDGKGNLIKD